LDAVTAKATSVVGLPANLTLETGASFDPTTGKLRVAMNHGQNLLINPDSGEVTTETAFHWRTGEPLAGGEPDLTALAYTNEVAQATTTTLYAFAGLNARRLSVAGGLNGNPSPDTGVLSTVAAFTYPWAAFTIGADNAAYGVLDGSFYAGSLDTGIGSLVGALGGGRNIIGLAPNAAPKLQSGSLNDGQVSGTVFHDAKGDGKNDGTAAGEEPLQGWTV